MALKCDQILEEPDPNGILEHKKNDGTKTNSYCTV